ncbi:MAG TPA: glycosyltransferase family 9 protein [Candidatus Polarisedimenticolaceae bacterium]|nr:glycosyltransferase family 9 protein [Candidatus Polarisedimenticolaceae bacterium]
MKRLDATVGVALNRLLSLLPSRRGNGDASPRRILVVKLAAIGDGILLVPSLRALRRKFPKARIDFLGTSFTVPVVRMFPEYVDECMTIEVGRWRLVRTLRERRYDAAVDFEQWTRVTPILLALARIPLRAGFESEGQRRHHSFTRTVPHRPDAHEVENFGSLAAILTGERTETTLELRVESGALAGVRATVSERGWDGKTPLIVIHPGCGTHGYPRQWPPERYRELAERLAAIHAAFVVVSGTPEEASAVHAVANSLPVPSCVFFIERFENFVALVSLASLVVSGNNGAMHAAAALKTPQVVVNGPIDSRRWGPFSPNARVVESTCPGCPSTHLGFEYHRTDGYCMAQIGVDEVLAACQGLLAQGAR